mgnify:CR=1 FL=1
MTSRTRYDRAITLDLEQTCWRTPEPPPGLRMEIIEIGLAEIDLRAGAILRAESFLVRNTDSPISDYCTELTGLTQVRIDREGRPLPEALNRIAKHWPVRSRPVFTWGDDIAELEAECARKSARTDLFPDRHDLAGLYRALAQARGDDRPGSGSGVSVEDALTSLGLAFEGTPHRAGDDARNTGRILLEIARRTWR